MTPAAVALNTIPVVIPALNEAATIGDVVRSPAKPGLRGCLHQSRAMAKPAGGECWLKRWKSPTASTSLGRPWNLSATSIARKI
jgi:hypothetical protein